MFLKYVSIVYVVLYCHVTFFMKRARGPICTSLYDCPALATLLGRFKRLQELITVSKLFIG